jgi:hypothetical protein
MPCKAPRSNRLSVVNLEERDGGFFISFYIKSLNIKNDTRANYIKKIMYIYM